MSEQDCMKIFVFLIESDVHTFWPDYKIDEDFINLFIKCGFDLLEN